MEITLTIPLTAEALRAQADEFRQLADCLPKFGIAATLPISGTATPPVPAADIPPGLPVDVPAPPVPASDIPEPPAPETLAPKKTEPAPIIDDSGVELDSGGTPYDPAIHAGNKAKKQDGTWKARRGQGKPPASKDATVTFAQVQTAMGALIATGMDLTEIDKPISQAVSIDLSVINGGMNLILISDDQPAACRRAMGALRALAVSAGVDLA